jgi:hypothetical protein
MLSGCAQRSRRCRQGARRWRQSLLGESLVQIEEAAMLESFCPACRGTDGHLSSQSACCTRTRSALHLCRLATVCQLRQCRRSLEHECGCACACTAQSRALPAKCRRRSSTHARCL